MVDRPPLAAPLHDLDVPHRWEGDVAHVSDEEDDGWFAILGPDGDGGSDTAVLGWTFSHVDE